MQTPTFKLIFNTESLDSCDISKAVKRSGVTGAKGPVNKVIEEELDIEPEEEDMSPWSS